MSSTLTQHTRTRIFQTSISNIKHNMTTIGNRQIVYNCCKIAHKVVIYYHLKDKKWGLPIDLTDTTTNNRLNM